MQSYSRPLRNIFALTLAKSYIKQDPVVDIIFEEPSVRIAAKLYRFSSISLMLRFTAFVRDCC